VLLRDQHPQKRILSQEEFGNQLNASRSVIVNIERGVARPRERTINLICNKYNVNKDWLLHGVEPVFNEFNKVEMLNDLFQRLTNEDQDYVINHIEKLLATAKTRDFTNVDQA
jgi:transcriptional regulator with XRE-family HTH domain